jgi:guanylate kinase
MPNLELLAHCRDTPGVRAAIEQAGGVLVPAGPAPVPGDPAGAADAGSISAGPRRRVTFHGDRWRIHLLTLLGRHELVEVRISYHREVELAGASRTLGELQRRLGIREIDIVPWSLEQTASMVAAAEQWRTKLGDLRGRLFLVDGPSGVGKSTLVHALRSEQLPGYVYVPRCTSRPRRPGDEVSQEYIPLSVADFERQIDEGRFLEYRQFLFNMSYGLRWDDLAAALLAPGTVAAYAMVNLGNIRHVHEFVPDATTILVTAPMEQIRERLTIRGAHEPAAIEERLHNAAKAVDAAELSDHVIRNANGGFEQALTDLRAVITGR